MSAVRLLIVAFIVSLLTVSTASATNSSVALSYSTIEADIDNSNTTPDLDDYITNYYVPAIESQSHKIITSELLSLKTFKLAATIRAPPSNS